MLYGSPRHVTNGMWIQTWLERLYRRNQFMQTWRLRSPITSCWQTGDSGGTMETNGWRSSRQRPENPEEEVNCYCDLSILWGAWSLHAQDEERKDFSRLVEINIFAFLHHSLWESDYWMVPTYNLYEFPHLLHLESHRISTRHSFTTPTRTNRMISVSLHLAKLTPKLVYYMSYIRINEMGYRYK